MTHPLPTAADFHTLSPCALAAVLTQRHVMDDGLRPLWTPMPRAAPGRDQGAGLSGVHSPRSPL
ncbi:hypothetical protein DFI_19290 (plasmid) [Deinococcus ficus]|uniref:Uncharacterized protein n=1 Tax=Deinococcus ficus TaxID=317577 RepID=A0A221T363_9DEIO|nr:hypothetical protein DFI_19290 [Deinococcus ficus]